MAKKFSRRNLFRLKWDDLSELVRGTIQVNPDGDNESERYIRPPGANPDDQVFLDTCDHCQECSKACPYNVIKHLGVINEDDEGAPYLEPAVDPCRWCPEMPCIKACPSGALSMEENKPVLPIAKARLNLNLCLTQHGILCDTCSYRCPTHIGAITIKNRTPQLDWEACTGCGMCVYHCDSEPSSFSIEFLESKD